MKAKHWAIIALIAFGVLKLPLEQRAAESFKRSGTLSPPPDLGVVENLTQMGAAAALGGLRSFVASITFLQSVTAFEHNDWAQVDSTLRIVTRLQPRVDFYWQTAANHMAFDAAAYYERDETRPTLYRRRLYREHVERGIEILKQGLEFLPESGRLEENLAQFYAWRVQPPDHRQSGEHYLRASRMPDRSATQRKVNERMAAYQWAKTDDANLLKQAHLILRTQRDPRRPMAGLENALRDIERKLSQPR